MIKDRPTTLIGGHHIGKRLFSMENCIRNAIFAGRLKKEAESAYSIGCVFLDEMNSSYLKEDIKNEL